MSFPGSTGKASRLPRMASALTTQVVLSARVGPVDTVVGGYTQAAAYNVAEVASVSPRASKPRSRLCLAVVYRSG
jgi:hypothetical protein